LESIDAGFIFYRRESRKNWKSLLMKLNEKNEAVSFSTCIDRFESWVLSDKKSAFRSALDCASILSELNFRALELSGPNPKGLGEFDEPKIDPSELEFARQAGLKLPLRYYLKIFDPSDPTDTEPVTGDLVDDIVDIYKDTVPSNRLFKNGDIDDALWYWNFGFRSHWGWHATSALNTLNAYLMHQSLEYSEFQK